MWISIWLGEVALSGNDDTQSLIYIFIRCAVVYLHFRTVNEHFFTELIKIRTISERNELLLWKKKNCIPFCCFQCIRVLFFYVLFLSFLFFLFLFFYFLFITFCRGSKQITGGATINCAKSSTISNRLEITEKAHAFVFVWVLVIRIIAIPSKYTTEQNQP